MAQLQSPSARSVLARLLWMLFGPMALLILTVTIVKRGGGWFTAADFGFLAVLVVMMAARLWEFRLGAPQTASGEPAAPTHLHRYLVGALVVGMALWAVANYFGNHW